MQIRALTDPTAQALIADRLTELVEGYSLYDVIHALTALCYRRAGRGTEPDASVWLDVAGRLTVAESCSMRLP